MSDHDELLARADAEVAELRHLYRFCRTSDGSPLHVWRLIELVEALRAALAARPQPLFEGTMGDFIRRFDTLHQPAPHLLDRIVVYPALAGSATPTDRCRSMEDGTPLTCEFRAGHDGPHSFDSQPLCGTCGQPLENGKCFRYHPEAPAGSATPTGDDDV